MLQPENLCHTEKKLCAPRQRNLATISLPKFYDNKIAIELSSFSFGLLLNYIEIELNDEIYNMAVLLELQQRAILCCDPFKSRTIIKKFAGRMESLILFNLSKLTFQFLNKVKLVTD